MPDPAEDYDKTRLHTCIDLTCSHITRCVHYLGMFGVGWIDGSGQSHDKCKLEPLPKQQPSKETKRASRNAKARARRLEAINAAKQQQQRLEELRDLPPWMLKPCSPHAEVPCECLRGLNECSDAKFCLMQRLTARVKMQ
jgi:hypothetical protein